MTSSPFASTLEKLVRTRGVRAAAIVSARDGVVIAAIVQAGGEEARVAALAASLYAKARRATDAARLGDTGFMLLEAEGGRLCALGGNELLLVVVCARDGNVGVVRVEMLRAAEKLAA